MDSKTTAETVICGGSKSPSSWISSGRRIRNNYPGADRRLVDPPKDSYSCHTAAEWPSTGDCNV